MQTLAPNTIEDLEGLPAVPEAPPAELGDPAAPPAARRMLLGTVAMLLLVGVVVAIVLAGGSSKPKPPPKPKHHGPVVRASLSEAQVAALDRNGVVRIISTGDPGSPLVALNNGSQVLGSGSGIVWNAAKGLIVTNAHVVVNGSGVQVGFDKASLTQAKIVGVDLADDIAVLQVSPALLPGLKTLARANPTSVQQGDSAYALGFPGDGGDDFLKTPFQVTTGSVSATQGVSITVDTDPLDGPNDNAGLFESGLYQTDAAINPGNSGGPLVNNMGQVIGMDSAANESAHTVGFAIPIAKLDAVVPTLTQGSSIGYPGFATDALSSDLAGALHIPGGLLITSVTAGTPADQNGLTQLLSTATSASAFLLVTKINNQEVLNEQQYVDALKQLQSGESFTVSIEALDSDGHVVPDTSITLSLTMP